MRKANAMKPLVAAVVLAACSDGVLERESALGGDSAKPYLERLENGVVFKRLLNVGDSVDGYRMVGIPDGLGAFDNGDGTFTVLMNHELGATVGVTRAHGAKGAFVSKWIVDKSTFQVLHGEDLMHSARTYAGGGVWNPPALGVAFGRFCSASLAPPGAVYNPATGRGYDGHIFLDGEEIGDEGRAVGHVVDGDEAGTSYQLPHMGRMSFENVVPNPAASDATVVAGTDDTGGGQVYVYVGTKQTSGSPVDRAGLTGGVLYGLKVTGVASETDATTIAPGTTLSMVALGDVSAMTGAALQSASVASGVTGFQRPEDGAWDPQNPNDFYFVTTASFTSKTRLWRLRFVDAANPAAGGQIDLLVDGGDPRMFDNLTVSRDGKVFIQEDPGNQAYLARLWRYDISSGSLDAIARFDDQVFGVPPGPSFLTQDEESSGILDVSDILGSGWLLLDIQAHKANPDPELVEYGQLLLMHVPPGLPAGR